MNYLTALFFAVDALMKMVAQGVLFTPSGYFQVDPSQHDFCQALISQHDFISHYMIPAQYCQPMVKLHPDGSLIPAALSTFDVPVQNTWHWKDTASMCS